MNAASSPDRSLVARVLGLALLLVPIVFVAANRVVAPGPAIETRFDSDNGLVFSATGEYRSLRPRAEWDVRALSLRTGKSLRFTSRLHSLDDKKPVLYEWVSETQVRARLLDPDSLQWRELGTFDADLSSAFAYSEDRYIAEFRSSGQLVVHDLKTGRKWAATCPGKKIQSHAAGLSLFVDAGCWVTQSPIAATGGSPFQHDVFSIINDQLQHAHQIPAGFAGWGLGCYYLAKSREVLERHHLADGRLLETRSLATEVGLQPTQVLSPYGWRDKVVLTVIHGIHSTKWVVDFMNGRVLIKNAVSISPTEMQGEHLLSLESGQTAVWRMTDGVCVRRIPDYGRQRKVWFFEGGKQLVLLNQDDSVQVVDLTTGEVIRTLRDRTWSHLAEIAAILGFVLWCGLLVHWGQRRWSGMVDFLVIHGLVLSFVTAISRYQFGPPSFLDLIGVMSLSCSIVWSTMTASWLVFGRTRWSLKLAGLLLMGAAILFVLSLATGRDPMAVVVFSASALAVGVLMIASMLVWRRLGWRISDTTDISGGPNAYRWPLRDIFWLTFAAAALAAVARTLSVSPIPTNFIWRAGLAVLAVFVTAQCAWWTGFSCWKWPWRILAIAPVGGMAGYVMAIGISSPSRLLLPWKEPVLLMLTIAALVVLSCYPFRQRGMRFIRSRSPSRS